MNAGLPNRIGSAMVWKSVELGADRVITLLRFIILARLLEPEDFGLLAIATVALDVLLTLSYFGMMPALVQRQHPEPRHYHAAWTINVIRGTVVAAIVVLGAPFIAELFNEPDAVNLIRLIAVRPFVSGFLSVRTADLRRDLAFRRLAAIEVPPGVVQTVVAIALVPWLGVYAIIAGMFAHALSHLVLSFVLAPYRPRLTTGGGAATQLIRFGRWYLGMAVLGVVAESALRVIVSRELGTLELGLYYLAARLVAAPMALVTVVHDVAFPLHATLQDHKERAAATFRSNVTALLVTLVPVFIALMLLTGPLIRDVLDERWDGSSGVIRVLALAALLTVVRHAVQPMLEGRGRPQWATGLDAVRSLLLLGAAWPLTARFGLLGAGLAVLVSEVPTQLLAAGMARRLLPSPFARLWRPLVSATVAAAAAGLAGLAVDSAVRAPFGFFAATATTGVLLIALLAIFDRLLGIGLIVQLVRVFPPLGRLRALRGLVEARERE